jgi:hypothetical protein
MYICKDCGEVFAECDTRSEYRGECFGFPAYEDYACCPYCESDDIEEVVVCKRCGKNFGESALTVGLCSKCEKEIQDKVTAFFEQFSDDEKEYILESGILDEV